MGSIRLVATLVPRGPAEHAAAVGEGAKRCPVVASVNGYTWRTTVTRMGGEFLVGLNRAVRQQAGVQVGDTVELELELDTAPREVDVPDALADALVADPDARAWPSIGSPIRTARSMPAGSPRPSATRRVNDAWRKRFDAPGRQDSELSPDPTAPRAREGSAASDTTTSRLSFGYREGGAGSWAGWPQGRMSGSTRRSSGRVTASLRVSRYRGVRGRRRGAARATVMA